MMRCRIFVITIIAMFCMANAWSQEIDRWDKSAGNDTSENIQWFRDAKFGLFIHWGLFSQMAGKYKGRDFFGSGEWLMNREKIPAAEYAKEAALLNPTAFNAEEWAKFAKASGFRYVVITAKHHEGFSMYDSKISDFNIVKATPYKKDPMASLAMAMRKEGLQFGFYYSQYLDWHEPNGGGNNWDFDEAKKNYSQYYHDKSIPQLKELLTNYGPLGILWFDEPGGLGKEETRQMIESLKKLQPHALFSSRVGNGLGDYIDFGDSEVPPVPIKQPWEAITTNNDSWGYIEHDMNFKSPKEIIRLLANVASKGGNLMMNVGPDGSGRIPPYALKYFEETGKWLARFGESIYGSTYGLVPAQPWGVTTSKPGRLFLHVMTRPSDGRLLVPNMAVSIGKIYQLDSRKAVPWRKSGDDLILDLPALSDDRNTVFVVTYSGVLKAPDLSAPLIISPQYPSCSAEAVFAKKSGAVKEETITFSHYFGDWKNMHCLTHFVGAADQADFTLRATSAGDYKIILDYACPEESSGQEGAIELDGREYLFQTLRTTTTYDYNVPLPFIRHAVAAVTIPAPGIYHLTIHPMKEGKDLFYLRSVILEPVK